MFASAADQNARFQRQNDRTGTGLFQMGAQGGASPELGQALKEQRNRMLTQQAGSDYVNAVAVGKAQHDNSATPLLNYSLNRTGTLGGLYGQNLGYASQNYAAHPYAASPWAGIATGLLQAGGQLGSAAITHGGF